MERSTTARSPSVSLRLDQCHRPSELTLRRAIRFAVPPCSGSSWPSAPTVPIASSGCPVAATLRRAPPSRSPRRLDHVLTRPRRSPGPSSSAPTSSPQSPGASWSSESFLPRTRFRRPPVRSTLSRRSRLRAPCAARCKAHCRACVSPGQAVFFNSQGCPPNTPMIPRSFSFVHRPSTSLSTPDHPRTARWVDVRGG